MEKIVTGTIFFLTFVAPSPQTQGALTPLNNLLPTPTPKIVQTKVPQFKTYTVQAGDTLDSISKENYGSGKFWASLWNDNEWIHNPTVIKKGWEMKIRNAKPKEVEDLSVKLQAVYDELNAPTPTPTPAPAVLGASSATLGTPSSFDNVYQQAGSKYGVPWQILYGIHLSETGLRDGSISSGYGTGAQGPMQFLPQTWNLYGVDGNGDGTVDINSASDSIYAAANYLAAHGSIEAGLRSYGGDTQAILSAARSRGYNQ